MEDQDDFDLEEVLGDFVDSASGSEVEMEEEEEDEVQATPPNQLTVGAAIGKY